MAARTATVVALLLRRAPAPPVRARAAAAGATLPHSCLLPPSLPPFATHSTAPCDHDKLTLRERGGDPPTYRAAAHERWRDAGRGPLRKLLARPASADSCRTSCRLRRARKQRKGVGARAKGCRTCERRGGWRGLSSVRCDLAGAWRAPPALEALTPTVATAAAACPPLLTFRGAGSLHPRRVQPSRRDAAAGQGVNGARPPAARGARRRGCREA